MKKSFILCSIGLLLLSVLKVQASTSFSLTKPVLSPINKAFSQSILPVRLSSQTPLSWSAKGTSSLNALPSFNYSKEPRIPLAPQNAFSASPLQFNSSNTSNMLSNRRLRYSSLWAFTSLNYLYADLVGLMDVNLLSQYQTGTVNGIAITPEFLTVAAAYMQLPLANVFLPQVIKNERTLRWVQIISGSIATLVQGSTLFVGQPSPYYTLFSVIEMSATAYITIDALKWKIARKK